jgi:hypothetical protein
MIRFYLLTIVACGILLYFIQPRSVPKPMYTKKFNTIAYIKHDSTPVIILDTVTIDNIFLYSVAKKDNNGNLIYLLIPGDNFY